jgi:hypothetical protein
LARPLNSSFTEPTQGERPLWVRIDARAMTDRVEHSTLPVGFKLGAPRGLLLQVCHGASRKVFNGTPARRRHPTTAMALEPQCSQPVSLTAATGAHRTVGVDVNRSSEIATVGIPVGEIPALRKGIVDAGSYLWAATIAVIISSASAISGISSVCEKPSSAGAKRSFALGKVRAGMPRRRGWDIQSWAGAGCSPAICVPPNRFQNLIRKPAVGSRFWVCRKPLARPR